MADTLPGDLLAVVDDLAARFPEEVPLDAIGEATALVTGRADHVDGVVAALEARGRVVKSPPGGDGAALLKTVLTAARALVVAGGRTPTPAELATATGLDEGTVRRALSFGKILSR